jgi:3-hydroxymyristoyl/3-hydroxydecanoyl-(acyl carrier protein) dehydratase
MLLLINMKNHQAQQQILQIIKLQISQSPWSNQSLFPDKKSNSQSSIRVDSTLTNAYAHHSNMIWNEDALLEFAQGNIANVFGAEYQIIDSYSRRVRLPLPPYLFVSRVTRIDAKKGEFKPSSLTTEYDIPHQAWYSVDRQVPWAITVESGQCDLLLISYLGIDFENKGELVYRLLDCTLTFLAELPKEGDTLRYDIKINSFVKTRDNLLFFFSYECFVKDVMILKMDGGCAGFFSDRQLEQGKGIIVRDRDMEERKKIQKQNFEPLLVCQKSTFDESDILHLSNGDMTACFGEHYCQYGLNPSLRLPPQKILMIDRVTSIDPTGGDWGLGLIIAEKNLDPEHWYFPCHFKDDQVMAGSLMAEGCGQLLQFYLLYLGMHTCTIDARFQPIYGLPQIVRCRGQVTTIHAKLIYRMEVTEISRKPQPYAKCNVDIILNDKIVVRFQDLGLQLVEKNGKIAQNVKTEKTELPTVFRQPSNQVVLLSKEQVQEFCMGSVAKCFGSEYAIYDSGGVKMSRMPNTHLNLVDRVLEVQGIRHQLVKGSTIVTEYDMPTEPWYYRQNSSPTIPYSILMEMALQPCGVLSAYLGTTFLYPNQNLYFRNLDGEGYVTELPELRSQTISNKATLISSVNIQGMIVQSFTFQLSCQGNIFYEGSASFGNFSEQALANQVGLDRAQETQPWFLTQKCLSLPEKTIDLRNLETRKDYYQPSDRQPYYRLAQHQLDLLHEVKIMEGGGYHHKGYIYAKKIVNPNDWYFKCHFYLDPVMPGSLGVEAILHAIQVYAISLNIGKTMKSPRFVPVNNHQVIWKYRGQIPYGEAQMQLEVHLSKIESQPNCITLIGDASLWRSNLRIYEVKNIAISLVESED